MNDRGATVRAVQLEQALDQLCADGELTDAQRQVVEQLSERLVERLLAVPVRVCETPAGPTTPIPSRRRSSCSGSVRDCVEVRPSSRPRRDAGRARVSRSRGIGGVSWRYHYMYTTSSQTRCPWFQRIRVIKVSRTCGSDTKR
ncbi:hypothetical protein ACFQH8_15290 [Halomicroarcula sp. GCM10025710]